MDHSSHDHHHVDHSSHGDMDHGSGSGGHTCNMNVSCLAPCIPPLDVPTVG